MSTNITPFSKIKASTFKRLHYEGYFLTYKLHIENDTNKFIVEIKLFTESITFSGNLKKDFTVDKLLHYTNKLIANFKEKSKYLETESKLQTCLSTNLIKYIKNEHGIWISLEEYLFKKDIDKKIRRCIKLVGENNVVLLYKEKYR